MELMGGTIELKSTYGKGTRMIVGVPLQKAPLTLVNMPAPDLPLGDLVREKVWILVTDDNELNREIITKTLTKMRFNVEAATDGLEAIAAVHRKRFDMILMDGQMHRLDGYEATRRIREDPDPQIANVKIVALTASAIAGDRERCLEVGMNDYLSKVSSLCLPKLSRVLIRLPRSAARPRQGSRSYDHQAPCHFSSQFSSRFRLRYARRRDCRPHVDGLLARRDGGSILQLPSSPLPP